MLTLLAAVAIGTGRPPMYRHALSEQTSLTAPISVEIAPKAVCKSPSHPC